MAVPAVPADTLMTRAAGGPSFSNAMLVHFINNLSLRVNEQALAGRSRTQVHYAPCFGDFAREHGMRPEQVRTLVDAWVQADSVAGNRDALLQGARLYYLRQLEASSRQYEQAAQRQEAVLPPALTGAALRDPAITEALTATCTAYLLAGNSSNEGGDHARAIGLYRRADSLLAVGPADALPPAMARQKDLLNELLAAALYEEGRRIGGEGGYGLLSQAVAIEQSLLSRYSQPAYPKEWARTMSNLGTLLEAQAEWVEESDSLYQASLAAFRAALTVYTRAEWPQDWARMQNNIGVVLSKQGAIEEAIAAFHAALEIHHQHKQAHDWALTQYNLGNTLQGLAVERPDSSGLLWQQSAAAYRQALSVFTAQADPDEWGCVQNKLGMSLFQQGRHTDGRALLTEAVNAFRAALSVRPKENAPAAWAHTQYNLGTALWEESCRAATGNISLMEEAVKAFESALTVYTQQDYPEQWFNTQNSLGLLYEQKQQWAAAIRHFENLRDMEPLYAAQKVNELRRKAKP